MTMVKFLRFRGESLAEAEAKAVGRLGSTARIHTSRSVRKAGLLGWLGRKEVEILASPVLEKKKEAGGVIEGRRRLLSRLNEVTGSVQSIYDGVESYTTAFEHLLGRGVSEKLAESLVLSLGTVVPAKRMCDFALVKEALRQRLCRIVRCSWGIDPSFESNVALMVGPTGVGKTTTVAKLAASMRLVNRLDVALVTTDTFRVGAVDQLRTYADAIGVPLRVARSHDELEAAVRSLAGCQVVLVDTAGLGSSESHWIAGLSETVRRIPHCTTYLLLGMGAHLANQMEVLRRVAPLRIDNFVLTKADECALPGHVLDLLVYTGVPVAYVTDGQNVPGDIAQARSEELADRILGPGYASLWPKG